MQYKPMGNQRVALQTPLKIVLSNIVGIIIFKAMEQML
jgi:hypothetical protein